MAFETVIDEIEIEIEEACRNFIYLAWENLTGGITFLGFAYNQENDLETEAEQEYQLPVTDLSNNYGGVFNYVQKLGREKLTISSENLTKEQIGYYRKIGLSPNVYILDNTTSPYEWRRVLVEDGSIGTFQTDYNNFSLTLTITLPEIFTISN
jgi:hypothetical protein